jgi:hypothetical protein
MFRSLVVLAACVTACTKKNPNYCEQDSDCNDPELPYCDPSGAVGNPHSCLRCPISGCGVDGGLDGSIDAPIDAPPQPALGLGKICDVNACPASGATVCTGIAQNGPRFCTLSCGTTIVGSTTPPAGGDTSCQQSMPPPPSGHPACLLSDMGTDPLVWYCAIQCGDAGPQHYGECPAGLTCTGNVCQ